MSRQFELLDWVVFVGVLSVSAFIGIFYAIRSRIGVNKDTTGEFLMGGRELQPIPVSISISVSYLPAILILGASAEMYTAGTLYFLYVVGFSLAALLAAGVFVPLLYPLKLTSTCEYLERRFESKAAKLTGTLIMIVQQILFMGITTYAPATALEVVTGYPTWATIVTIGGVSTFYTFLGGLKAVVWTDVFQSIIMVAGLLAIVVLGLLKVGGADEVRRLNAEWDRIEFWEGNPDPTLRHSVWSLVFGVAILWFGLLGVNQFSVQRYCSVPTLQRATWSILMNIAGIIILMTLICLAGVVMFAYYAKEGCDPLLDGAVKNANQLVPYFVIEVLVYPGVPGLFVACLFSGALSTMSSCLNALAAVCWEDMFKPYIGDKVSESTKTWIVKLIVVVFGAAGIGFSFMAKRLGGTVLQTALSFVGGASGPLLGIFLLGGLFPCANSVGCVTGGLSALVLSLWLSIGAYSLPRHGYPMRFPTTNCTLESMLEYDTSNTTTLVPDVATPYQLSGIEHIYTISYLWFPTISTLTTIIVGLVASYISAPYIYKDEIDPKYLIPVFDRLFCWLPESWRRKCRCGYDFKAPEDLVLLEEISAMQKQSMTVNINELCEGGSREARSHGNLEKGVSNYSKKSKRNSKNDYINMVFNGDSNDALY